VGAAGTEADGLSVPVAIRATSAAEIATNHISPPTELEMGELSLSLRKTRQAARGDDRQLEWRGNLREDNVLVGVPAPENGLSDVSCPLWRPRLIDLSRKERPVDCPARRMW
jgi:hypothetical protein